MAELTARQARFVEEYLIDLNATQAAIRAGYATSGASVEGCRLLANANILDAITAARKAITERNALTVDDVISELRKLAFSNMADYMRQTEAGDPYLDFSILTRKQMAALSEVAVESYTEGRGKDARRVKRVKFKLWDKRAALVDLGKHLGAFVERSQLLGKDGQPVDPAQATFVVEIKR